MLQLVIGLVLFLGTHSIAIVTPAGRERLVRRLGEWPYKIIYSLLAIAGLVLIARGYGDARIDPTLIYNPPPFLRHLSMLLMIIVFPALLATYLPGRVQQTLKHPMLVAVKAWALAHLLVNGTLADVLFFGGFLVWAVADRISLGRREPRAIPQIPKSPINDVIVIIGGLGLYVAFAFWLHPILFGVAVTA